MCAAHRPSVQSRAASRAPRGHRREDKGIKGAGGFLPSAPFGLLGLDALLGLDEDAGLGRPVHGEAQLFAQVTELIVGVGPALVVFQHDGLQRCRRAVEDRGDVPEPVYFVRTPFLI